MTKKIHFEHLKPANNIDISTYREALDFALAHERKIENDGAKQEDKQEDHQKDKQKLKNIALSGSYGAGKSSVIETYKVETPDLKFVHISLAHFSDEIEILEEEILNNEQTNGKLESVKTVRKKEKIIGETIESKKKLEQKLEQKIVNQLLHQIPPKLVPKTLFKVKKNNDKKEIGLFSGLIMLFISLLMYIIFFYTVERFIAELSSVKNMAWTIFFIHPITQLILFTVLLGIGTFFTYKLIQLQFNKSIIRKIKVKDNEMDLLSEVTDSYFDKYLNDVLYLFENIEADVIVFEDIDRFNSVGIFEKLNEINTLLNNSKSSKLSFLYLIKDDMFTSKERTKFFDMIIPVIPVLDSSNSFDNILKIFGKTNKEMNENFLYKLSLYIDDMRLLKNIYNEYILYKNGVGNENLVPEKLFSMMAYKNIFPKDFSDFQLNKGFLHTVFESKVDYIKAESYKLEQDLIEIEQIIKESDSESIEKTEDLEAQFFVDEPPIVKINNRNRKEFSDKKDLIRALKENDFNAHTKDNDYYGYVVQNYTEKFKKIQSVPEYKKRLFNIENKEKTKRSELEKKRTEIERQLNKVEQLSLKKLISKDKLKAIKVKNFSGTVNEFNKIKDSEYFSLILFLLINGYIDETYSNYMSKFYPESLSHADNQFIRSVIDGSELLPDFKLEKIDQIVTRLDLVDYSRDGILNYDLFNFILSEDNDRENELKSLVDNISNKNNLSFITNLYNTNDIKKQNILIKQLILMWPNLLDVLTGNINGIDESNVDKIDNDTIAKIILTALSVNNYRCITESNNVENIKYYLSNSSNFTNINDKFESQALVNLKSIGVSFVDVNFLDIADEVAQAIYDNYLYQINYKNIQDILIKFYHLPPSKIELLRRQNFSVIKKYSDGKLQKQLFSEDNINNYLEEYLSFSSDKLSDTPENVYIILNNLEIYERLLVDYIDKNITVLDNLLAVSRKTLWEQLLTKKTIKLTPKNITAYYSEYSQEDGWTDTLTNWVNDNSEPLNLNYNTFSEMEGLSTFIDETLVNMRLTNKRYREFVHAMNYTLTDDELFDKIDSEKLAILIELKLIEFNEVTLQALRSSTKENKFNFIISKIESYLDLVDNDYDFVNNAEIIELLSSSKITDFGIQTRLVKAHDGPITLETKNYSEKLKKYIIKNKFSENDIQYLISNYSTSSFEFQELITEYVLVDFIEQILSDDITIDDKNIVNVIVNDSRISFELRQELFSKKIDLFSIDEIQVLLKYLKFEEGFQKIFKFGRPKIVINENNERILAHFENKNWITSYLPKKNEDYYPVRSRDVSKFK